jgi:hypothetical protein
MRYTSQISWFNFSGKFWSKNRIPFWFAGARSVDLEGSFKDIEDKAERLLIELSNVPCNSQNEMFNCLNLLILKIGILELNCL